LVDQYRSAVEDIPASDVDQIILAAARRHCAVRRFTRRTRVALLITAVAVVAAGLSQRSHQLQADSARTADYGRREGVARSYLLNAPTLEYSGAGIAEGAP
jgi:hypothetical protein